MPNEFDIAYNAHHYPQTELRARIDFIMFWNDDESAETKVTKAQHFLSLVDNYDDTMSTYWFHKLLAQSVDERVGVNEFLDGCIFIADEIEPELEGLYAELNAFSTFDDVITSDVYPYEQHVRERPIIKE